MECSAIFCVSILAGWVNFFLQGVTFIMLFCLPSETFTVYSAAGVSIVWLGVLLLLNCVQTIPRLLLMSSLVQSQLLMDYERSVYIVKNTMKSSLWAMNCSVGALHDLVAIAGLFALEAYTNCNTANELTKSLMSNIGAATLINFFIRSLAAVCLTLKSKDPEAILEAKKRGADNADISSLPVFTYETSLEKITCNKDECSICLETYEQGDQLAVLPCDARHVFHVHCIKKWLALHNSCPFCQKML